MRTFVHHLSTDVKSGRESWRVYVAVSFVSFAAAMIHVLVRIP